MNSCWASFCGHILASRYEELCYWSITESHQVDASMSVVIKKNGPWNGENGKLGKVSIARSKWEALFAQKTSSVHQSLYESKKKPIIFCRFVVTKPSWDLGKYFSAHDVVTFTWAGTSEKWRKSLRIRSNRTSLEQCNFSPCLFGFFQFHAEKRANQRQAHCLRCASLFNRKSAVAQRKRSEKNTENKKDTNTSGRRRPKQEITRMQFERWGDKTIVLKQQAHPHRSHRLSSQTAFIVCVVGNNITGTRARMCPLGVCVFRKYCNKIHLRSVAAIYASSEATVIRNFFVSFRFTADGRFLTFS